MYLVAPRSIGYLAESLNDLMGAADRAAKSANIGYVHSEGDRNTYTVGVKLACSASLALIDE